jgi:hypothetical protein
MGKAAAPSTAPAATPRISGINAAFTLFSDDAGAKSKGGAGLRASF